MVGNNSIRFGTLALAVAKKELGIWGFGFVASGVVMVVGNLLLFSSLVRVVLTCSRVRIELSEEQAGSKP